MIEKEGLDELDDRRVGDLALIPSDGTRCSSESSTDSRGVFYGGSRRPVSETSLRC